MNRKPKRTIRETHSIHSNAPDKLVRHLHRVKWNQRELARQLEVNSGHINKLIRHGEEPSDETEEGRALRQKLYLPQRKKKVRPPKYTCMTYSEHIGAIIKTEGKRLKQTINQFKRRR